MKDWSIDAILLSVVALFIILSLFLGVINIIKKSFKVAPSSQRIDSSEIIREQKRRIEDIKRQEGILRRSQEQKLRDLRHRR